MTFLRDVAAECGPVGTFRFGPRRFTLLSDPDLIGQVLMKQHKCFEKSRALKAARRIMGNGLLTSEHEEHTRNRRLMQPAFHMQRIMAYADCMVRFAHENQARWTDGAEIDIAADMMGLTLRIAGKTLFNSDTTALAERVSHSLGLLMDHFPLLQIPGIEYIFKLPLPLVQRIRAAKRELDEMVLAIITERRLIGRDEGDLLSMLLASQEDDEAGTRSGMSDQQVRDEVLTLFLAGHETTAAALSWTWYLLTQHPDVAARTREEIRTVLGDAAPTMADSRRLPFTEAVLTESMRLYPPAWTLARSVTQDVELAGLPGVTLARGSTVFMTQAVMHRQERYFPEPDRFLPDRWTPEFRERLPRYAYFPFGGGPRACIGESFAWMELILVMATLARHWTMELVPSHRVVFQPAVTLRPRNGIRVRLRRVD